MSTDSIELGETSANNATSMTMRRTGQAVAWGMLSLCVLTFFYSLVYLSNSYIGFALVFGSGIITYECILIIKRIMNMRLPVNGTRGYH